MADKEHLLELALFLDSPPAGALNDIDRAEIRSLVSTTQELAKERLGKPAAELDGEDVRALLVELLPTTLAKSDPLAPHVPRILEAFFDHLEEEHIAVHSFERRQALATHADTFLEAVQTRASSRRPSATRETFVHGASKLGRNDPCSCGSGKKFKKCHGKNT